MLHRSCAGSALVEFAVVAPVLILLLFGTIEIGVIFFLQSTLQNAADDAARMVRTGQVQSRNMTEAQYVAQICSEMTGIIASTTCNTKLEVDMEAFNSFSNADYSNVFNANGTINQNDLQFETGDACDVVLVRAFYPWSIMTPMMAPLLQNIPNGQVLLMAGQAFRNEPYTAGATC
ncbi:MAG TPA: TadE/TadG family type IV pilus assembly protein [Rhizomicrobium sp.]|jgi:Flp pilus assembly protein TadG|nr:TadE/TadG family type IV pilus assembly protein [Rhizomicrobium sp.]